MDPASYQEPWDMIPTADNNFTATIYNKNFKEGFEFFMRDWPELKLPKYHDYVDINHILIHNQYNYEYL